MSNKRPPHTRQKSKILLCSLSFAGLTFLAGCELAPVYLNGKSEVGSSAVSGLAQQLATIALDEPTNRAEQIIYADLSFAIHGSVPEQVKLYELHVTASASSAKITSADTGNPEKLYRTTMTANFTLIDSSDESEVLRESRFSSAQFTNSDQTTANTKAREKAEENAAMDLSNMIRARLTAYFNSGI